MADIGFSCSDHTHLWAIPSCAAWVKSERPRKTGSGLIYRPDIVILETADHPLAIVEVTDRNRVNNCRRAADELQIPWFRFWAPPPESTHAVLATRTCPEGHWFRDSDGFHVEVDGYEQDGIISPAGHPVPGHGSRDPERCSPPSTRPSHLHELPGEAAWHLCLRGYW